MGDIERPQPGPQLEHTDRAAPLLDQVAIGQRRRNARQQHKGIGCIREPEIMRHERRDDVARHVIDEDHQQRQSADHVDAGIALSLSQPHRLCRAVAQHQEALQ